MQLTTIMPSRNGIHLFLLMLILTTSAVRAEEDDCEPELSDDCLSTFKRDLLDAKQERNLSSSAAKELCLSLQDGLSCASDVIDRDCRTETKGRRRFNSWLKAFQKVHKQLCARDAYVLKAILNMLECWDPNEFLQCTDQHINVSQVEDLFNKQQDCSLLKAAFETCSEQATIDSCREQESSEEVIGDLLSTFLDSSHCSDSAGTVPFTITLLVLSVGTLFFTPL